MLSRNKVMQFNSRSTYSSYNVYHRDKQKSFVPELNFVSEVRQAQGELYPNIYTHKNVVVIYR